MKKILILLFAIAANCAYSQNTKTLNPTLGISHDLSAEAEQTLKVRDSLNDENYNGKLDEKQKQRLDSLYEIYPETRSSIWDVIGDGADWTDYGGPFAVRASSSLKPSNGIIYEATNTKDLRLETAWVEGAKGNGEGEFLEYYFKNDSPRVTKAIIINGYVKTPELWAANNRVKDLDLYINGEFYAKLQLKDVQAEQIFELPTLGRREDGKDLILTFVIKSVYPGTKYNDTAITEIYFQGMDVY